MKNAPARLDPDFKAFNVADQRRRLVDNTNARRGPWRDALTILIAFVLSAAGGFATVALAVLLGG